MPVRPARPADYTAFVRLFDTLETGDETTPQPQWEQRRMPYTLVYEEAGQIVGYVYFQVLNDTGYIRQLAVATDHRRRGIGRSLMAAVAGSLRQAGVPTWCLNVKPDNVGAIALYEGLGMRMRHTTQVLRLRWETVERLPEATVDIEVRSVSPRDSAAVEAALDLPKGLIDAQRSTDCHVLVASRGHRPIGIAAFHPSFPGAHPFRVQDLGSARALLAAMRTRRDETKDFVQLVVEDAAVVTHDLLDAGAWLHLEIVHLQGPVCGT